MKPISTKIVAAMGVAILTVALTACGGQTNSAGVTSYNLDAIKSDPEIVAMVPQANRDTLRVAMDIPYSPAMFLDDQNQPIGYEVDVVKALARVMGVTNLEIIDEDFDAIIPLVNDGTYDVGMASITINKHRLYQANLVAYIQAGYIYGTQAGNPQNFDPADPCGRKVGVKSDTSQAETLYQTSESCVKAGKPAIQIVPDADQSKLVEQVATGTLDAIIGESPNLAYDESQNENFALAGEAFQVAPQGPATAKDNVELAKAMQAGLQRMMDTGLLKDVLAPWGEEFIALNYATLNPPIA